jgi:hypothetical protein
VSATGRTRGSAPTRAAACSRSASSATPRAGLTVGGPPGLLAKLAVHLRAITFADVYANPTAYDDDELLDTLTDAILRLVYGTTPAGR